ncbi:MAG: ATP-binding domain-containing protein [Burkholderiaceae bacterium]
MAQVHPAGWRELALTGAAQREIETLTLLAAALPDDYTVFHGVHWTNVDRGFSAYGEIDFIVVAPSGRILLIEQKSGFLTETEEGLAKKYPGMDKPKLVRNQLLRNVTALMQRFGKGGEALSIDYLLYCPDYQVKRLELAGIDAARIVDARSKESLPALIQRILPLGPVSPQRERVLRFLSDVLQLLPDPSAMIGQAHALVTRLAGGLALWARQLDFTPFRLRVIGTAGSGKTQLALAAFSDALASGKKPLYVSYNRPLADHVSRLVPSGGRVASFHQLCDSFAREQGSVPDYSEPEVWKKLEQQLATASLPDAWQFDVLIVDEGQDFSTSWRDALLRLLKPDGRAIWLEDPMQNLYGRESIDLPGWVGLRSDTNYRSPRQIVELLASLAPAPQQMEAASPFAGADIDFLTYPSGDDAQLFAQTRQAITRCLAAGFSRQDMAIVSFRGRDKSALLNLDALGSHSLKSFDGSYDLFGNPVFRSGELLTESVYRFKGQSAPAVIFTEIDFETMDEKNFRKLFVGMTRARLKLVLVMSEKATAQCRQFSG